MSKYIAAVILTVLAISLPHDLYSEQLEKDMRAIVVVLPTFKVSIDNASINFGFVEPGTSAVLYPERNYNEVKCRSNKGKTWYLRLSIVGDVSGPVNSKVKPEHFKWQVYSGDGDGMVEKEWQPLSRTPVQAYTSGPSDNSGKEVTLKFKYKLDLPANAAGGIYGVNVLYTMTDNL